MKYLVITQDNSGRRNANIFDTEEDARQFLNEVASFFKYPMTVNWTSATSFVVNITEFDSINCRIAEMERAEYRLVRHKAGEEDEERRFFKRQNAVKFVKEADGIITPANNHSGSWMNDDPKGCSYKLYAAVLDPNGTSRVISRFESFSAEGTVNNCLGDYLDSGPDYAEDEEGHKEVRTSEPDRDDVKRVKTFKKVDVLKNKIKTFSKRHKKAKIISLSAAIVVLITLVVLINLDWQLIADERKASQYGINAEIKTMANDLYLTRKGKAVLYASQPKLKDNYDFNKTCGRDGHGETYIAGCYYKDNNGDEYIDIFDVGSTTVSENGVIFDFSAYRKTVILHEMLHAVWERKSESDQIKICSDLKNIANSIGTMRDEISIYDEGSVCTELFARIGSEYISILNAHSSYSQYFNAGSVLNKDRSAIKRVSDVYDDYFEFTNYLISEKYWSSVKQLSSFADKVVAYSQEIESKKKTAESLIRLYNSWPTWNRYNNASNAINAYNNMVPTYNSYISTYNKIMDKLDSERLMGPWSTLGF